MGCSNSNSKALLNTEKKSRKSLGGRSSLSLFNESSIIVMGEEIEEEERKLNEELKTEYIEVEDKCIGTDDLILWNDFHENFDYYKEQMINEQNRLNSLFTSNSNAKKNNFSVEDERIFFIQQRRDNAIVEDKGSNSSYEEEKSRSEITGNNVKLVGNKKIFYMDAKAVKKRQLERGKSRTIQNSPVYEKRQLEIENNSKTPPINGIGVRDNSTQLKNKDNKDFESGKKQLEISDDEENLIPIIKNAIENSKTNIKKENDDMNLLTSKENNPNPNINKTFKKLESKIIEEDKEDDQSNESLKIRGIRTEKPVIKMKSCAEVAKISQRKSSSHNSDSDEESSDINILEDEINLMNNTMVQY